MLTILPPSDILVAACCIAKNGAFAFGANM